MSKPFLTIKPTKKDKKVVSTPIPVIEEVVIEVNDPYFTYIDDNGVEQRYEGKYTKKSNGSYVYEHSGLIRCIVKDVPTYAYNTINSHFAYYDNEGNKRTCNRIDTIEYCEETNTYFGEKGETVYIDEEIEIYENK